ncbi:MAG: hypothetical protein JXR18_03395 [Neptuniibacter sp.]
MEMNGVQPMGPPPGMGGQKPPSAEEMAERMVEAVDSGDIDAETLVENLESRFGEEASAVLAEDGSIDVEALTELLSSFDPANQSGQGEQAGAMPPPPPPGGMIDEEELQAKLAEDFGEEAAAAVFSEDGSLDFEALKELLQSQNSSETGTLLSTSV